MGHRPRSGDKKISNLKLIIWQSINLSIGSRTLPPSCTSFVDDCSTEWNACVWLWSEVAIHGFPLCTYWCCLEWPGKFDSSKKNGCEFFNPRNSISSVLSNGCQLFQSSFFQPAVLAGTATRMKTSEAEVLSMRNQLNLVNHFRLCRHRRRQLG